MRTFKIEIKQLITLMTRLDSICAANGIDWRLADDQAEIEATDVPTALEQVRTRLGIVYRAKFPKYVFDEESICVDFRLRDGVCGGPVVASGSVTVSNYAQTLTVDDPVRAS